MARTNDISNNNYNAVTPRHQPQQQNEHQPAQRHIAVTTWHVNGPFRTCHDV
jgi:hypothetical protein